MMMVRMMMVVMHYCSSPKGRIPKQVMTMSAWKVSVWGPWPTCRPCRTNTPRPWRGARRLSKKQTSTSEYFSYNVWIFIDDFLWFSITNMNISDNKSSIHWHYSQLLLTTQVHLSAPVPMQIDYFSLPWVSACSGRKPLHVSVVNCILLTRVRRCQNVSYWRYYFRKYQDVW